MNSVISKKMKVSEIKEILKSHGIETAYGWEIMLYMIFNTYEAEELIVEGFGENAEFRPQIQQAEGGG